MDQILALLKLAGTAAGGAVAIKTLFSSGSSGKSTQQQQQQVLAAITPSVVNQLQNEGLALPPGQEQQYVQAVLSGQLPANSVNYIVPAAIASLALFILFKD